MTRDTFWSSLTGTKNQTLADEIAKTRFDELLEIDLAAGRIRRIRHVENKYTGNLAYESAGSFFSFVLDHYITPEERERYCAFFNLETLQERLREAGGIISGDFRIKGVDRQWIDTRNIFVSGSELGMPETVVSLYVYDMNTEWQAESVVVCDEVTGLPGRLDFFREAKQRVDEAGEGWCLIYLEIDHHKLFTDWYGLEMGQHMLIHVSEAVQRITRKYHGVPGYIGEAIFAATLPYDMTIIRQLYDDVLNVISEVCEIDGFRPMIGIAPLDDPGNDFRDYFNKAALTVEEIRDDMHTWIRVYDVELHKRNSKEYRILHDFEGAIKRGEVTFYLQPQCRMEGRKIVGAEALTRWRSPEGEMIPPNVFIPILEKYGLIAELDRFIWNSVCRWIRSWIDRGHEPVPVSVNVSQIDIFSLDVPACFEELVGKYGIDRKHIKIEITESAYVEDSNNVKEAVRRLREMDFTVLMDDFGSGYSSLNMLNSVNVDVIKLDARFLQADEDEEKSISILESIVNMTRNLETPVIIEGVETYEQMKFLSDLGCRYAQGFFFYRPMPVSQFEKLIEKDTQIDRYGIVPKLNQQVHILDVAQVSESMLNNLIGPTAVYYLHGEDVDIIRYNEQFFRIVGMSESDFNERVAAVQRFVHPGDKDKLYELMQKAETHHVIGSKGVVRAIRPDGIITFLSLQFYFIDKDENGKTFYVSAQDVSENQFISTDLPGAYFRCMTVEEDCAFLFVSRNFIDLTGYSEEDLLTEFDNKYVNMLHPADKETFKWESKEIGAGRLESIRPYRIRRKRGDYIYVTETSHITDHYGAPCWQKVLIDVTQLMHNQNQMRVLSAFFGETVLFLSEYGTELRYEAAIHGLRSVFGMEGWELEDALNRGEFCTWVEGFDSKGLTHEEYTLYFMNSIAGSEKRLEVHLPNGRDLSLMVLARKIVGDDSNIKFMINMRKV